MKNKIVVLQELIRTFDDVLFIYSRTISRIKSGFKQSKYFLPNGKPYEEISNRISCKKKTPSTNSKIFEMLFSSGIK